MTTKGSWGELFRGRSALQAITLSGGVGLHAVNVYVATTILPSVVRDIGGLDYYAWNTTLFVVASIVGSALSARPLQTFGPRGAFGLALLLFTAGSLVCGVAPSMQVMLVGRTLQGFGGGLVFALSYVIIRLIYSEALWPRAMALVSGMWGISTLFGPAVGGFFAEMDAWRAAFWTVAGIAVLLLLLAFAVLPKRTTDEDRRAPIAFAQLVLLAGAVLAISIGSVSKAINHNIIGIAVALVLVMLLCVIEGRASTRLFPHRALNVFSPLGAAYAALALLVFSVPGSEIFVPYFLQILHGLSPLAAGYLAAVMAASWTVAQIGGAGLKGGGARKAILLAGPIMIVGFLGMAWLTPIQSDVDVELLAALVVALLLIGFGVGLAWPHLLTRVLHVAPEDEQNLAASAITTIQLFATALGAAVAGMIANLAGLTNPGGVEGAATAAHWLFLLFAIAPLLAFPVAISITNGMRAASRSTGVEGAGVAGY